MDIYFESNYGKLYEEIENATAETFHFKSENGAIKHQFMKRQLKIENSTTEYVDIVTPYGYGGPLITERIEGQEQALVKEFNQAFEQYCEDNHVVSEFIRFHPVIGNATDFESIYQVDYIRNTVGTNLHTYDDPFQEEFSRSCRKNVRKALKNGITFRVTEKPEDIRDFKEIYHATMDRNQATDYYYFDEDYFDKCLEYFQGNLLTVEAIYQEKTIAMGLYFIYDKMIHIHLSGTRTEYLSLSPAYILRYAVTQWGKESGYEMIHHGGGRSNAPDDSLYTFKKQFGTHTEFPFHTGKKIWNHDIYNKLCADNGIEQTGDFFPAYRQVSALKFNK